MCDVDVGRAVVAWARLPVDCQAAVVQLLGNVHTMRLAQVSRYWRRKAFSMRRDLTIHNWPRQSLTIAKCRNLETIIFETVDKLTDLKWQSRMRALWSKNPNPTRLTFLQPLALTSLLAILPEFPRSLTFLHVHLERHEDGLAVLHKVITIISQHLTNLETLVFLPGDTFLSDTQFIQFLNAISPLEALSKLRDFHYDHLGWNAPDWSMSPELILALGPKRPGLNLWAHRSSCLSNCLGAATFDRPRADFLISNGADPSIVGPATIIGLPSALASCKTLDAVHYLCGKNLDMLEAMFRNGGRGLILELLSTLRFELVEAVLLGPAAQQLQARLERPLLSPYFLLETIRDAENTTYQANIEKIITLHSAGKIDIVGLDLDAQGCVDRGTLLHWAVVKNWPDVVNALLASGANPRICDSVGTLPIETALRHSADFYSNASRSARLIAEALVRAAPDVPLPLNRLHIALDCSLINAIDNIVTYADPIELHDMLAATRKPEQVRFAATHDTMLLHIATIDQEFHVMPRILSRCSFTPQELSNPNSLCSVIVQTHPGDKSAAHLEVALRAGAPLALSELQSIRFYLNDEEMIDHVLPFINYAAWTRQDRFFTMQKSSTSSIPSAMLFWATAEKHQPGIKFLRALAEKMFESGSGMDPELRTFLVTGNYGIFSKIVEQTLQTHSVAMSDADRSAGVEAIDFLIKALLNSKSEVDWVELDQRTISHWSASMYKSSVSALEAFQRLQSLIKPLVLVVQ